MLILLPLTPSTKLIINSETLRLLPPRAVIINAGRGLLINESHLLDALDSGKIGHATLDVFSEEPLPASHPFWSHKKVTVTPHIAAATRPNSTARALVKSIIQIRKVLSQIN